MHGKQVDEVGFEVNWTVPAGSRAFPTAQAEDIASRLFPEWWDLFRRKNEGYGRVDNHLGPRGVFPDVNRKVGKLERAIWDGQPLPEGSEPVREVIMDLIGHLFLMLHMVDAEGYPAPLDPADYMPGAGEVAPDEASDYQQMADEQGAGTPAAQPWYSGLCPDPARHTDGWSLLPDEVREALRMVAGGGRIRDADRVAVVDLVKHNEGTV